MAKWPSSGNVYPGTPKAYPVLPKAYPGSSFAAYPVGLLTGDFSQSSGVDVVAAALGVADFSQANTVEATATLSALTPAQLRVQVSEAAITLGATMRASGTTPPVVLLAAGSGSLTFGAGLCPGFWVDILPGALTFDLSFNSGSTVTFAAQTIPVGGGDYTIPSGTYAGMIITFPLGAYNADNLYEGTVTTILSTEGNSYTFTQATAATKPVFRDSAVTADGKDALFFAGAQWLGSTDAAVLTLFTNDPAYTIIGRIAYTTADAAGRWFSVAQTAGTNGKRGYGQVVTGAGRECCVWINDGNVANGTHTCATDPLTGGTAAHNICFYGPGSGGALAIDVNGANETISPNTAAFGTLTPTRAAIGAVADNSADTFLSGHVYDLAVFNTQLDGTDRGLWDDALTDGTPS